MNNKAAIIIPAVIGMLISVVGYFFRIMHWPGGQNILITGGILILVSLVFILINLLRKEDR